MIGIRINREAEEGLGYKCVAVLGVCVSVCVCAGSLPCMCTWRLLFVSERASCAFMVRSSLIFEPKVTGAPQRRLAIKEQETGWRSEIFGDTIGVGNLPEKISRWPNATRPEKDNNLIWSIEKRESCQVTNLGPSGGPRHVKKTHAISGHVCGIMSKPLALYTLLAMYKIPWTATTIPLTVHFFHET